MGQSAPSPPSTHAQICGGQLIACAGGLGQAGSLSAVGILVFLVFMVAVKDMCFFKPPERWYWLRSDGEAQRIEQRTSVASTLIKTECCPLGSELLESVGATVLSPKDSIQVLHPGPGDGGRRQFRPVRVSLGCLGLAGGARRWPWTQTQQRRASLWCVLRGGGLTGFSETLSGSSPSIAASATASLKVRWRGPP